MGKLAVLLILSALSLDAQFYGASHNAIRLRGRIISNATPADTNVMCWVAGSSWWAPCASGGAPSGSAGGVLAGTYPNPALSLTATVPSTGTFSSAAGYWLLQEGTQSAKLYNLGSYCWSSTGINTGTADVCVARNAAGIMEVNNGTAGVFAALKTSALTLSSFIASTGVTFASLPASPVNGYLIFCSDCTKATPCAAAGPGAFAKRLNAAWDCN